MERFKWYFLMAFVVFAACSPRAFVTRSGKNLLNNTVFQNAHVGISIYDADANKTLYNYQSDKYFVPASNVKLFSMYAGLKYLGDSLPGIRFRETPDTFYIFPTGDPTFLHPLFPDHPVFRKLKSVSKPMAMSEDAWHDDPYGMGWSWDDYNDSYMAEKSPFPVYGNAIRWIQSVQTGAFPELATANQTFVFSEPDVNWRVQFIEDTSNKTFRVDRRRGENVFEILQGGEAWKEQEVPFITNGIASALELLKDTLQKEIAPLNAESVAIDGTDSTVYSQLKDSLLRSMMHRSDNFFAEQVLLMVSNEMMGKMNTRAVIDSIMKSDLSSLPDHPTWVDGSGLSRYNLFTPEDFVWLLKKLKDEYGLNRLKTILPSGNEGTLAGYYEQQQGKIFAKTGTLTGNLAISGYLITAGNKLLLFSILVNNHRSSPREIRRSIEKFISGLQKKY